MEGIIDVFQDAWFIRALLASSMVGIVCGVLGCFIVLRNMSLIGDALAHSILPGVVFAFMAVGLSTTSFFYGSVLAGLITVAVITWIQQNVNTKNDAAIGIVYTTMFSIGVIGISSIDQQEGVHLDLKDFLFGNVLGVSNEDLYLIGGILIYVLLSVILLYRYLYAVTFQSVIAKTMGIPVQLVHYFLMLLLAVAVVASVRTVGIILQVAMLIIPASTALLIWKRLKQVIIAAALIGLLSTVVGLFLSVLLDAPPGPVMVVFAAMLYLLAVFLAPEKGLLFKFLRQQRKRRKIRLEDFIKQAYRLNEKGALSLTNLAIHLNLNNRQVQRHLQLLRTRDFFEKDQLQLTEKGEQTAQKLTRAHRLWETYLVEQLGLAENQIHEDAEKLEHLLTEELIDEVDDKLGYPQHDPHGSPIPTRRNGIHLSELSQNATATITHQQISNLVTSKLWDLGLMPDIPIAIKAKATNYIEVEQSNRKIQIPADLARAIAIEVEEG